MSVTAAPACTRVASGESIPYTPNADVLAGAAIKVGKMLGIAMHPISANVRGALAVDGRHLITKKANDTFSQGDTCYWDNGNSYITSTSSGNTAVGRAAKAALAADAQVEVLLLPALGGA